MADVRQILLEKYKIWTERYKAKDFKGIGEMYTKDCRFLPNGAPATGKDGLLQYLEEFRKSGVVEADMRVEEVIEAGDRVILRRSSKLMSAEGKVTAAAKDLLVWKQEDGEWKMDIHIYNLDS